MVACLSTTDAPRHGLRGGIYAADRLDPGLFVWQNATAGVDIFFVISGFVMMIAPPFRATKIDLLY